MFDGIKLRIFIAKIQAEIRAQHQDQYFINRICQESSIVEQLSVLKEQAYYRKDSAATFIYACYVLSEGMSNPEFSLDERQVCASLLSQRLERVSSNPAFRMRHIIIFGELEEKMQTWGRMNDIT